MEKEKLTILFELQSIIDRLKELKSSDENTHLADIGCISHFIANDLKATGDRALKYHYDGLEYKLQEKKWQLNK